MMEKERIAMVRNLMNSLPEKQRTAMQLRDFEDKSYKEIAEIMQISEDQVTVAVLSSFQPTLVTFPKKIVSVSSAYTCNSGIIVITMQPIKIKDKIE